MQVFCALWFAGGMSDPMGTEAQAGVRSGVPAEVAQQVDQGGWVWGCRCWARGCGGLLLALRQTRVNTLACGSK